MEKINTAEGTGNERVEFAIVNIDLGVLANMGENVVLAELDERKLSVVGMGREI